MAKVFDADFTALYIDTEKNLSEANNLRLKENTAFAKTQGAKIVTLKGLNIPFQVCEYAKKSNVTKIILGRSGYKPNTLFTPPNFVDKIIQYSPNIEIYIIPDKAQKMYLGQEKNQRYKFSLLSYTCLIFFIILFFIFDYFLTEPHFSLKIHFNGYPIIFLIFLCLYILLQSLIKNKKKQ